MTKFKDIPSQDRLQECLDYNPETGEFHWIEPTGNRRIVNQETGPSTCNQGYNRIAIDNNRYGAHRIAWVWMTGEDITGYYVHHKNENRTDNRFSNLALVTNADNIRVSKRGKGYHRTRSGTYQARIRVNYEQIYLGTFKTEEEANQAYLDARLKYFGWTA